MEPLGINGKDKKALVAAIEKFTALHESHELDHSLKKYRELIPKSAPGPGQQYAFEVDLDKCTGCKACVTACHNENGLDDDEIWRSVGLIQGGTSESPVMQHVTSACHHCADPACMTGCPTKAYVKDDATGIVKHLEDQCFGCQYCTLKCPYDVPKYSKKRGIVHKCDMCIGRLTAGQAPACARACPNGAIRITLVDAQDVKKKHQQFNNVPDAPRSDYTYPTTRYTTKRVWPDNTTSLDYVQLKPEHSHWPLVGMLVLTQLSVGTILAEIVLQQAAPLAITALLSAIHRWTALAMGLLALGVSVLHLGRPLYAFRAVLGFKTSWLSREIVVFGLFAFLAVMYAWNINILSTMNYVVFLSGLIGILCSVMVYRDTKRPFWDNNMTTAKFLLTMSILGFATSLMISVVFLAATDPVLIASLMESTGRMFCWVILGSSLIKMLLEASVFCSLAGDDKHFMKKTAILLTRPLKKVTVWRYVLGIIGGIVLPLLMIFNNLYILPAVCLGVAVLLGAEFLERYLFFRAVVPLQLLGQKPKGTPGVPEVTL